MAAFHSHRPAFRGAASIFVYCQFRQPNAASLLLAYRATVIDEQVKATLLERGSESIDSLFIYIYVYWTLQRCSSLKWKYIKKYKKYFFHTDALHPLVTAHTQTKKYQMEAEEGMWAIQGHWPHTGEEAIAVSLAKSHF